MNDFRSRILTGKCAAETGLVTTKRPRNKARGADNLESVSVPRTETRSTNHRDDHRHRLLDDRSAQARHGRKLHDVRLINLSGGGAMIEAPFRPELWDRVELELGDSKTCGALECAVRWIKNDRIGLEFAHETRIGADTVVRDTLLREVLANSFPDVGVEVAAAQLAEPVPAAPSEPDSEPGNYVARRESRHPLIWFGHVHFDHDTHPVRLRNISATGALIEGGPAFPVGGEMLLDLDEAGSHFATVSWARGDQAGLSFRSPFDLAALAKSKPQLAPSRWAKPAYLRDQSTETSPWASEWGRLSLSDLHKTLGRR